MDESSPNQPSPVDQPVAATPSPVGATPITANPVLPPAEPPSPAPEPLIYPEMSKVDQLAQVPQPAPAEASQNWLKIILLGILNWAVIPLVIVFVLHNFVFQAFHVIGSSMVPTLHETDYLIISKVGATESQIARVFGKSSPYIPKRDEIIVFHYPKDPSLVFVKRVIGLPGERVVVHNGAVTVYNGASPHGFNPDQNTVRTQYPTLDEVDETVPASNVFVLGDNRTPNGSYDSREWGMLPSSYIIGNATLRLLPVDKAGIL